MTDTTFSLESVQARVAAVPDALPIGIRVVDIGRGALDRLADHLRPAPTGPLVVLVDGTPMSRGAGDVVAFVVDHLTARREVRVVTAPAPGGRAHADAATLDTVTAGVTGAAALITVGSGTLADIGKAVAGRLDGLEHAIVQTALSVNGFADDQSVLLIDGVKRTTPSRWPDVLVADTEILRAAPVALNAAGVGDLLAMFTAPADWRLATTLGMGAGYSPGLVGLVREQGPALLSAARRLGEHDSGATDLVAEVLTLSGIAMGAAGMTAPSSGAEHTISHLLEMAAYDAGRPAAFHGAQVGVSTIVTALLWRRVIAILRAGEVELSVPDEPSSEAAVRSAFARLDPSGATGEECWRLYRRKLSRWSGRQAELAALDWAALADDIEPMLADPAELVAALRGAGAPTRFRDLDPAVDGETARWAVQHCDLMRDRFAVVDLARFLGGWEPADVDAVLAEAAVIGAGL